MFTGCPGGVDPVPVAVSLAGTLHNKKPAWSPVGVEAVGPGRVGGLDSVKYPYGVCVCGFINGLAPFYQPFYFPRQYLYFG